MKPRAGVALLMLLLAWTAPGAWAASLARPEATEPRNECPRGDASTRPSTVDAVAPRVADAPVASAHAKVGSGDDAVLPCRPALPAPAIEEPSAPAPNWRRLLPGLLK